MRIVSGVAVGSVSTAIAVAAVAPSTASIVARARILTSSLLSCSLSRNIFIGCKMHPPTCVKIIAAFVWTAADNSAVGKSTVQTLSK